MEWRRQGATSRAPRPWARRFVLPLFLAAVLVLPATAGGAGARPATHPDTTPPPPEESPFSGADAFCVPSDATTPGDLRASMPGVAATTVDVALLVTTASAADAGDHFADLVNACGGIHGRRLVVHTLVSTGDPAADCAAVTGTRSAVVGVAAEVDLDACVRANPELIAVAPGATTSNDVLATTHGRWFVGGVDDGPLDARVQDLVDHADLASTRFAVVTGDDDAARAFRVELAAVLAAHDLHPVRRLTGPAATVAPRLHRARVAAVLTDSLDPTLTRALAALPDSPTTYVMTGAPPPARPAGARARVQAWVDPRSAASTAGLAPSPFAAQCAAWAAAPVPGTRRPAGGSSTTTAPAGADDTLTSVCLTLRLVARGLFGAGPNPTARDVLVALHDLPNTDRAGFGGEPPARPNQLVNERVRRVDTVVVRAQLTEPCPPATGPSRTPTTPGDRTACWVPVNGYTDGGRAIDTVLTRVGAGH